MAQKGILVYNNGIISRPENTMSEKNDLKATLNLPRTSFAMKAALSQKEPAMIRKWEEADLYRKILEARQGRPLFILHDGPPYANGRIHLGTALNKILKDFIIRSRSMEGFLAPFVPGWDCHGLPIEIHVDKKLGPAKKTMSVTDIRGECRSYALKYIDIQREEFRRLGVMGEWDNPYLTMDPTYEAGVLRFLAAFFDSGEVYLGKRPVHWCISCRTALAEAEIEYGDKTSPSIYVKFPLISDLSAKAAALAGKRVSILIWTTTPWTLPGNLAIALDPEAEYAAAGIGNEAVILARRLLPVVAEELGWDEPEVLAVFAGRDLENLEARHPFIDRISRLVMADYVTMDDGTGCVHTAPGHGQDDYMTGLAYGFDIYAPVDDDGRFTPEVPRYAGLNVFEANPRITADMAAEGTLLKEDAVTHSYPHCWRCKKPVIFRATEQWFISMDKKGLRSRALEHIARVRWLPSWGEERISGMVANRPDWCISRQRSWGVPIPAFRCRACGSPLVNADLIRRTADIFATEGSNAWYTRSEAELLSPDAVCRECGGRNFQKTYDILDVWFESGASHGILKDRPLHRWPADVYIEGHDQHRGWFNSSLFIGVGAEGCSPFETCITHGFVLDEQGRAMSKSLGNVIEPDAIIRRSGAEILRLWAAMLNYREDARFGREIEQRLVDAYRKIRNTWRFLLGNLFDFDPDRDAAPDKNLGFLDRWVLQRGEDVRRKVLAAYRDFEYHIVFHTLFQFFTVDLSSFYLDVVKDRVYCSAKDDPVRRAAQTAMFRILRDSLLLMAPILPFTTDEAWEAAPEYAGKEASVHLGEFPKEDRTWISEDERRDARNLIEIREVVLKEIEKAREAKHLGNSLEARAVLKATGLQADLLRRHAAGLREMFIVSDVAIEPGDAGALSVRIERAPGAKCDRCWNFSPGLGLRPASPALCPRCAAAVERYGP